MCKLSSHPPSEIALLWTEYLIYVIINMGSYIGIDFSIHLCV